MVFSSALRGFLPSLALVGVGLVSPLVAAAPPEVVRDLPLATDGLKAEEGEGGEAEPSEGDEGLSEPEPEPEPAPDDDEARKQAALASFEEARRLFLAEDFAAAAVEFRRSFETLPSLEALVAAARAHARAGDPVAAIDAYEEYAEFEDENVERYAKAMERLRLLRAEVGELVLRVEDPSQILSMTLNGERVSFEDFPRLAMPGELVLEIRFVEVDEPRSITSQVRRGETTVLEISPSVVVTPPQPERSTERSTVVEPKPPSLLGLRVAFWGGVGLSAAAGIAVATLGGLTLRQRGIYKAALCETGVCPQAAVYPFTEEARFYTLKRATNVGVGIGIGVAAVTVVVGAVLKTRQSAARRGSAGIDLSGGALTFRF